jgi:riboflavin biosynthesis pyrimidine reductase
VIRQLLPSAGFLTSPESVEAFYLHPRDVHLRLNLVTSLDGALEVDGLSGPLGVPADREAFVAMRAVADVVLVGAGTVRAENYGPVKLGADRRARREARGQTGVPRLAVVSGAATFDAASPLFDSEGTVIVYTTDSQASRRGDLSGVAEVVGVGAQDVDLTSVVADLRRRGLGRIVCEGGPTLFGGLIGAGLVDELCVTVSPLLAGCGRLGFAQGSAYAPVALSLQAVCEGDGALLLRYKAVDGP